MEVDMTGTVLLEEFHDDGAKAGVLIRKFVGQDLDSIMTVRFGDHLLRLVQHTEFAGPTGPEWRSFTYIGHNETTSASCSADGIVTVSGKAMPALERAVPSYAAVRILLDFLAGKQRETTYREFLERDLTVYDARLIRLGKESVETPTGTVEATRIELHRGSTLANTFWEQDGHLVASDWNGAMSYPVDDRNTLVKGLHPDVVTTIDDFLAG